VRPVPAAAAVVLGLIAVMQSLRVILRWEITLNGARVPIWLSEIALVLAAILAVLLWRDARRP
jgi:hypothetical protein